MNSNILQKNFDIKTQKGKKQVSIYVDLDKFKSNASSIIYASEKTPIIAWVEVDEYEIICEAVGDVKMYDANTDKYYWNEILPYLKDVLITEENIEKYGCTVEESNCFEIRYLAKREDGAYEFYGGSDDIFTCLDSTPEQLINRMYTETIIFLEHII